VRVGRRRARRWPSPARVEIRELDPEAMRNERSRSIRVSRRISYREHRGGSFQAFGVGSM